jgi:hypothetical protein
MSYERLKADMVRKLLSEPPQNSGVPGRRMVLTVPPTSLSKIVQKRSNERNARNK